MSVYEDTLSTRYKNQTEKEYERIKEIHRSLTRRLVFSTIVRRQVKVIFEAFVKNLTVCAMKRTVEAKRVIVSADDVKNAVSGYCDYLLRPTYDLPPNRIKNLEETFKSVTKELDYSNLALLGIYEILRKHKILKLQDHHLEYIDFKTPAHINSEMKDLFYYLAQCKMEKEYNTAMHQYAFKFLYFLGIRCVKIIDTKYSHAQLFNSADTTNIAFHYNDLLKALRMLNISFFQHNQSIFHMNGIYSHLPFAKIDKKLIHENVVVEHPEYKHNTSVCVFGDFEEGAKYNKDPKILVKETKAHYNKNILTYNK